MYDKTYTTTINHVLVPGGIRDCKEPISVTVNYNDQYPLAGINIIEPLINSEGILMFECDNASWRALVLNYEIEYEDGSSMTTQMSGVVSGDDNMMSLVKVMPQHKGINAVSMIINVDDSI